MTLAASATDPSAYAEEKAYSPKEIKDFFKQYRTERSAFSEKAFCFIPYDAIPQQQNAEYDIPDGSPEVKMPFVHEGEKIQDGGGSKRSGGNESKEEPVIQAYQILLNTGFLFSRNAFMPSM